MVRFTTRQSRSNVFHSASLATMVGREAGVSAAEEVVQQRRGAGRWRRHRFCLWRRLLSPSSSPCYRRCFGFVAALLCGAAALPHECRHRHRSHPQYSFSVACASPKAAALFSDSPLQIDVRSLNMTRRLLSSSSSCGSVDLAFDLGYFSSLLSRFFFAFGQRHLTFSIIFQLLCASLRFPFESFVLVSPPCLKLAELFTELPTSASRFGCLFSSRFELFSSRPLPAFQQYRV